MSVFIKALFICDLGSWFECIVEIVLVNLNQWTGGHSLDPWHKSEVLCLCVEYPLAKPSTLGTCRLMVAVRVYFDCTGTVKRDAKFFRSSGWHGVQNQGLVACDMEV